MLKLLKNFKTNLINILVFIAVIVLMILSEVKIISFSYLTIVMILAGGFIGVITLLSNKKIQDEGEQK